MNTKAQVGVPWRYCTTLLVPVQPGQPGQPSDEAQTSAALVWLEDPKVLVQQGRRAWLLLKSVLGLFGRSWSNYRDRRLDELAQRAGQGLRRVWAGRHQVVWVDVQTALTVATEYRREPLSRCTPEAQRLWWDVLVNLLQAHIDECLKIEEVVEPEPLLRPEPGRVETVRMKLPPYLADRWTDDYVTEGAAQALGIRRAVVDRLRFEVSQARHRQLRGTSVARKPWKTDVADLKVRSVPCSLELYREHTLLYRKGWVEQPTRTVVVQAVHAAVEALEKRTGE